MASPGEGELFHDVEQRFLRLTAQLEAVSAERDALRSSAAKSESKLAEVTLRSQAAARSEVDANERREPAGYVGRTLGGRGARVATANLGG